MNNKQNNILHSGIIYLIKFNKAELKSHGWQTIYTPYGSIVCKATFSSNKMKELLYQSLALF